jgi:glutamate synthase (NADPH/NADH) small chain
MRFVLGCIPGERLRGKKVAVIGSGPAGLVAAGFLGCSGAEVDVYDKLPEPGGLLIFAIPSDRLSPERIRGGVKDVLQSYNVNFLGRAKVVGGKEVREEGDEFVKSKVYLGDIIDKYHAVLIATGTWRSRSLGIPGEDLSNVFKALDFLFRVKSWRLGYLSHEEVPNISGKRVAVIGAGLSAVDAASEALKMNASKVYILYRRSIKEAPAGEGEIRKLIELGIEWVELVIPTKILGSGGSVRAVELLRCRLGEPDESGRPKPVPIEGSEFELEVDVVINSIGELPTPPIADGEFGIRLGRDGRILVNEEGRTSRESVFAAGDVVTGPSKIGPAMKDGFKVARAIADYLMKL